MYILVCISLFLFLYFFFLNFISRFRNYQKSADVRWKSSMCRSARVKKGATAGEKKTWIESPNNLNRLTWDFFFSFFFFCQTTSRCDFNHASMNILLPIQDGHVLFWINFFRHPLGPRSGMWASANNSSSTLPCGSM